MTTTTTTTMTLAADPDAELAEALHGRHSSLREKMLETIFLAELSRVLWRWGRRDVEVLRAEVDRAGYDVVVECAGVLRHIQLKSRIRGGKADGVPVSLALGTKPSGCVVWIHYDPLTMETGPYLYFGAAPGQPLPDLGTKIVKHTKGNKDGVKAERAGHRMLAGSRFITLATMEEVATWLFGIVDPKPAICRLAALAAFAPRIREAMEAAEASGMSPGGRWTFNNADGTPSLPHFIYDDLLSGFIGMACASGWVSPEVDWMAWLESGAAGPLLVDPSACAEADEAILERMMTALVRAERFGEGGLAGALGSGVLLRMAERAGTLARSK